MGRPGGLAAAVAPGGATEPYASGPGRPASRQWADVVPGASLVGEVAVAVDLLQVHAGPNDPGCLVVDLALTHELS